MTIHRSPHLRTPRCFPYRLAVSSLAAAITLTLTACDGGRVEEQQVPAGSTPIAEGQAPPTVTPPAASLPAAPGAETPPGTAEFPWTVPAGWTLDPEPREMRLATYVAPAGDDTAQIAVTRFPGEVGGELANVNRWRGQMGLAPVNDAELPTLLSRFESGDITGYALRIDGPVTHMVAAGIRDPNADVTWFVRVIASPEVVDAVEGDVMAFARSVADALSGGGG